MNVLPGNDDRYRKTKIRTYDDQVYTNFRGLNVLEDSVEHKSFAIISVDSLLIYGNKYYLQVYLYNICAYKTVNTEMADYVDCNLFETYYFWGFINAVLLSNKFSN